jgi:hypothetical protein
MSSWQVAGLGTDHTEPIQVMIRDFIKSNWSLNGKLHVNRILFGTGWYDKSRELQIHFKRDSPSDQRPKSIGINGLYEFRDVINVHFWVSIETDNIEPPDLNQMYTEIQRIVGENVTALAATQGINYMRFIRPPYTLPSGSSNMSLWHGVGGLSVLYYKLFV